MTSLVIGNSAYPGQELKNTTNDSEDVTTKLGDFGFSVIHLSNAKKEDIDKSVKSFRDNLNSNDIGLFYFAGHGMQIEGDNYITAVDTDFETEMDAKYSSYPLNKIIEIMEKSKNKTNIIILDACRNNPYERAWHRSASQRGLAPIYAPKGTIIAYATSPGEVASDGKNRNGAYTEAMLRHISTPDITIEEMFKRVRNSLAVITKNKQTSWEHTSLAGDFFFNVSLGNSVEIYSKEAISDELYMLDKTKPLHDEISDLKSHNWYVQNPAARDVKKKTINKADVDSAFVFGRNIYQASCGSSDGSTDYIVSFKEKTAGVDEENRKAILDGMLFEVFFTSKGEIRENFKTSKFNRVFEYQKYSEFDESYNFIADILIPYQSRFYVIPGKRKEVTIDIQSTENKKGEHKITGVYFAGNNILREDDDYDFYEEDGEVPYEAMRKSAFEKKLSEDMLISASKLNIQFSFEGNSRSKILFPYGFTIEK